MGIRKILSLLVVLFTTSTSAAYGQWSVKGIQDEAGKICTAYLDPQVMNAENEKNGTGFAILVFENSMRIYMFRTGTWPNPTFYVTTEYNGKIYIPESVDFVDNNLVAKIPLGNQTAILTATPNMKLSSLAVYDQPNHVDSTPPQRME